MSKDVNKFLNEMIKYDLYGGIILSLILSITVNTKFSIIYFLGIIVSLANFFIGGKIMKNMLEKKRGGMLFPISGFVRILIIVGIAVPFMGKLINLIAYITGYISHFVFLTIYWVKSQKGSD
ncbi:ATP synthase subunit I [Clostridium gasigenes]|uniref:ATP synthase subunit I n=1 Tax=Clostridium gasigenes TaxID=94869 RepID=UPI001C0D36F4|nr:ATP synthase subunit I [Clostridium gasigenes]MBU3108185.1 hypothetical protein [Clostridium gasigenes]